ncbi:MAG TPA: SpoIIE family protein phosphatase, partial [Pontiella sp.]
RKMQEIERHIMESGTSIRGSVEHEHRKNGTSAWISTSKVPVWNRDGHIVGTFGISRDITRQKEMEIRSARYADEIRDIKEQMEDEVEMASELQKSFFPKFYPVFPAGVHPQDSCIEFLHQHHPLGMISGNLCSIRSVSSTEVGIFLFDVVGSGVRAALISSLAWALQEEIALEEMDDPGSFLQHLNSHLFPILCDSEDRSSASACYLVFNTETGRIKFSSAGSPVPFLFRSTNSSAEELMLTPFSIGPDLASRKNVDYRTFETTISAGDSIVMYTSGICNVIGSDKEVFGSKRLLEVASKNVGRELFCIFPALLNAARDFSVNGEFDDDISLVGFKWKGRG